MPAGCRKERSELGPPTPPALKSGPSRRCRCGRRRQGIFPISPGLTSRPGAAAAPPGAESVATSWRSGPFPDVRIRAARPGKRMNGTATLEARPVGRLSARLVGLRSCGVWRWAPQRLLHPAEHAHTAWHRGWRQPSLGSSDLRICGCMQRYLELLPFGRCRLTHWPTSMLPLSQRRLRSTNPSRPGHHRSLYLPWLSEASVDAGWSSFLFTSHPGGLRRQTEVPRCRIGPPTAKASPPIPAEMRRRSVVPPPPSDLTGDMELIAAPRPSAASLQGEPADSSDSDSTHAPGADPADVDAVGGGKDGKDVAAAGFSEDVAVEDEGEATGPANPTVSAAFDPGPPPDGGYGWVIVAGAFAIHLFVFAPQYAYGVYSRYYYESQMYPGVSLTTITFVGAVAAAGCPAFGPISGRLSDLYGPRPVCFVGGCIVGIAFILASFSTQIWMLFLTQGFLYGLGQSLAYFPYIGTLPTWFGAKRGLAVGLAVSGTGIGGFAFGPLTNLMITNLSVQWSLRITGMIIFAMVSISAFVLRSRYKPIRRKSVMAGATKATKPKLIDFSFFKNRHFSMMWAVQLTGFFGFFSPYLFLSTYAASVGLSQSQGALIVGLTNLGSTLGRVIVGFGSDRLGPFNSFSLCIFLSGLSMMLIWPFSRSLGALIFFGMFYAFFSGGFVSLQPSCLSAIIGLQAMASAIGLLYFAGTAANLAGPPLSGALITNPNEPSGYIPMMMFGGAFMLLSGSIMLFLRMERAKWKMWVRV